MKAAKKMNKDMHSFLEDLDRDMPGSVIRIKKEVAPEFEIPAILHRITSQKRQPVLFFEKVRNLKGNLSDLPVITNLFGSRKRLAHAIGSTVLALPLDYAAREKPIPAVVIGKDGAKVKEIIKQGETVDLLDLPIITHHEMNLGPYIASGSIWTKDPDTKRVNCTIARIFIAGPRCLVVNFNPAGHSRQMFEKHRALGIPLPLVIVIGHHPAFYMGAQTKQFVNEPDIIGGMMGEPLELTPSETWGSDIFVPAQADLVIEAELSTTTMDIEAPFGEYPQYYAGQKLNPVAEVKAITHRKDAWYLDIMPGHPDHLLLDAPTIEAYLYSRIKAVVPGLIAVHVPVSGTARFHAYIQIKKRNDAEPKTAIAAALSSDFRLKHAFVVDDDVDIYDDEQVLWAVATRSQWDKDLLILPGMMGTIADPSADGSFTAKGGIDATRPVDPHAFAKRISIPSSILDHIKLEDYLDPEVLKQFQYERI